MKFRRDFVTNSSSSSFILAVRKDITEEQIQLFIEEIKPNIVSYVKDYVEYGYDIDIDRKVTEIIIDLTNMIRYHSYPMMNLEGWTVNIGENIDTQYCCLDGFLHCSKGFVRDYLKMTIGGT